MGDELQGKITRQEWASAMDYARALATKFARAHGLTDEIDDLRGEALLGLSIALDRFEPAHASGARFTTFAHRAIVNRLEAYRLKRAKHRRLGTLSLDYTGDDTGDTLLLPEGLSEPANESHEAAVIRRHMLADALRHLDADSQELLRHRFHEQLTLQETAAKLGLSPSGVLWRQQAALERLRALMVEIGG